MTDTKADARARGQALRAERIVRARKIRRRVISGAVALFVAAWLMITFMLISGHDPALASKASTTSSGTAVASTPSTTTATTSSSGSGSTVSGSGTNSGTSSSSSASSPNSGVSSVTTSQS